MGQVAEETPSLFEYESELFMVIARDTVIGGSQEGWEWELGGGEND